MRLACAIFLPAVLSCLPLSRGTFRSAGESGQTARTDSVRYSCAIDTNISGFQWIRERHSDGLPKARYAAIVRGNGDTMQHGPCSLWYETGKPMLTSVYRNGLVCGKQKTWWKDGTPESECEYVDGRPHGRESYWNEAGHMIRLNTYVNGVLNGEYVRWYENGYKKEEGLFRDGVQHGLAIYYFRTGKRKEEREYGNGRIISRKVYSITNEQYY